MKQKVTAMSESRDLKMLSLQFTTDITEVDCLHGFKTMKMLSLNYFCLERRYGMMMVARNVILFRMPRIVAWYIQYLRN
jgi:hypothetical protein